MPDKAQLRPVATNGAGYVLEEQIGHLLRRAHQRATALFMERMNGLQLTPTQFAALAKILDTGTVSQNELGRMTAMDPATMQGVMQRLCERRLVARNADPADRRRSMLSLTAEGRALIERAVVIGTRITEETLAPLSADERRRFLALLIKLT